MTIDDKIRDKNLQNDVNKEAINISALSCGKIDKYEYVTGKEILPSDQVNKLTSYVYLFFPKKTFRKKEKQLKVNE